MRHRPSALLLSAAIQFIGRGAQSPIVIVADARPVGRAALCLLGAVAGSKQVARVWRAAEAFEGLPVGTEISLRGDELLAGPRGVAFSSTSGRPFHIELVEDHDLEDFLLRRTPTEGVSASATPAVNPGSGQDLCRHGRFLLNDPRLGLLMNQRISHETALLVAAALGRTLVLPGFFKFPHPDAYDGTQWVSVRRLFDWSVLQGCYNNIIELGDLLELCGPDVLDNHVTVPFETMWMRSRSKAPWINGTRPELRWEAPNGRSIVRLRSNTTLPELPLNLLDPFWRLVRPFLSIHVASARTVRTHGLISNVTKDLSGREMCFVPEPGLMEEVKAFHAQLSGEAGGHHRLLGIHLRLFTRNTNTSGGYLVAELANMQEDLCNLGPEEFSLIVSTVLSRSFNNFWPTHAFLASNAGNAQLALQYLAGLPGPRRNPYTPLHYDAAVTSDQSTEALRSVLFDIAVCASAEYFVGNACSTISEYIHYLRLRFGLSMSSSVLLAGVQHAQLLEAARAVVREQWPNGGL